MHAIRMRIALQRRRIGSGKSGWHRDRSGPRGPSAGAAAAAAAAAGDMQRTTAALR